MSPFGSHYNILIHDALDVLLFKLTDGLLPYRFDFGLPILLNRFFFSTLFSQFVLCHCIRFPNTVILDQRNPLISIKNTGFVSKTFLFGLSTPFRSSLF